jgi:hypothetical protein
MKIDDLEKLLELANVVRVDGEKCILHGNKSAGKRARKAALEISQLCVPIRKVLLEKYGRK